MSAYHFVIFLENRLFAISTHFSGSDIFRSDIFFSIFFNFIPDIFCTSNPALAFISKSFGPSSVITRSSAKYHKFTKYCTFDERNSISSQ